MKYCEVVNPCKQVSDFLYYTLMKIKWQYIFFDFVGICIIRGRNLHIFIIEKHKKEKKDVVFL